jgi:predicted alpha/beta-fold hydrolase
VTDLANLATARPGWWIRGPHLQTIWARLARSRRLIGFEREVLATPDGDELVLDHIAGPAGAPRVILLHGTEGSAYSLHTQGLAVLIARAGWRGTVLNFRSCARDPRDIRVRLRNRTARLYHSGETTDLDQGRVRRARTIREFDDCVTAPLHGFTGADDYYARASALPYLGRVGVPTLCINGLDDPFYPGPAVEPARVAASVDVTFAVTSWGGHTGFVSGPWPWRPVYWAEEAVIAWLASHGLVTIPTQTRS